MPAICDFTSQLRDGSFEINCRELRLTRKTNENEVCSGPGIIQQRKPSGFTFRLFPTSNNCEAFGPKSGLVDEAGKLIGDDDKFLLTAKGLDGIQWSGIVNLPSYHSDFDGNCHLVKGTLFELRHEASVPVTFANAYFEMAFATCIEIPSNKTTTTTKELDGEHVWWSAQADTAVISTCGGNFRFTCERAPSASSVYVEFLGDYPRFFDQRLIEALQFVLASRVDWLALKISQGNSEIVRIRNPAKAVTSRRQPPIRTYGTYDPTGCFWELFSKYLEYILPFETTLWHPLSYTYFYSAIDGSTGSVDAEALSVSVAVESILSLAFADLGCASGIELQAIEALEKYIEGWQGVPDSEVKQRVLKFVRESMPRRSAKSRLLELAKSGAISQPLIAAWNKLRPTTAHGSLNSKLTMQQKLDLIGQVVVLLNQLVFNAIRYQGKYTDYGTIGWPYQDFSQAVSVANIDVEVLHNQSA